MSYPVLEVVDELKGKLAHHPIVILQAPPGAGKSTVLPLHLLHEPWLNNKKIILLEPRRLAARSVAARLSDLHGEEVGQTIGYRVRFENVVSKNTRIEVVTEGILTRMIQTDNALSDVGLVIFDEFHERSLQADLALALCYQSQQVLREDLRLLIMSATLDGEKISSVLDQAPIVTSLGKQYPVSLKYEAPDKDSSIAHATARVIRKALTEQSGDVLVFLPGTAEIHKTTELLQEQSPAVIMPLYGDLPLRQQQEAILPHPQGLRKIVLATSIAETSLTIEGITTVIDSGYARVPRFDPRSGLTRLETIRVTRDAADQRAGRAGRLGPGVCYRMWAENTHAHLQPHRQPEVLEADLAPMLLEVYQWGIKNVNELKWITVPPAGTINQAKELLNDLGALRDDRITERGKEMLKLPTHPRLSHMLLSPADEKGKQLATDVAALLEERDPLMKDSGADLSLRLEALRKWRKGERVNADRNVMQRIERLAASWRKMFRLDPDNGIVSDTEVGKLLMEAYPERIAQQVEPQRERYKLANGRMVRLPDHDPLLRESWLCVAHLDAGSRGEGKIFLAAPIDISDAEEHAEKKESIRWDAERGQIMAAEEKRIGTLVISAKPTTTISETQRIEVLCDALRQEGLRILNWDDEQINWQARVSSLRVWRPEEEWPMVDDEHLLQTADEWLAPYLIQVNKRSDFFKLDMHAIRSGLLPWNLSNQLDVLAPARLKVPSGSNIALRYFNDGQSPVMEVRLQEMFGLLETPTVNQGRTKIMLHLLSPGYKPVQVTQDLKSFWQTTYHEVRKELRMRYPRHHWPEDPWTAEAVRGAVKRRSF
ncbi:MAG: ATP-dependent helicase HrpB [Bacteroidetes bacterium]|nr:ATP-dependent helicase HrpB [Bacteroidota bacterium]